MADRVKTQGEDRSFSVLMSLYAKEDPKYLKSCLESLLAQTVQASEWVIVEDGPLTDDLYAVLDMYESAYPGLIRRVTLERNGGLGPALREGVLHCSNDLIARMDTDDIAVSRRFELQLAMFDEDPELDICGGQIAEFDEDPGRVTGYRTVPTEHDGIVAYQRWRSAFNHMTVMYKKQAVMEAGNYEDAPLMEDDVLWAHMIMAGARCTNCDEVLVLARANDAMIDRRGTLSYLVKYYNGRRIMLECGFVSHAELWASMLVQTIVALAPHGVRKALFRMLLRVGEGGR